MTGYRALALILLAISVYPISAQAAVGADGKSVPTQSITIPPDPSTDGGDDAAPAAKPAPAAPSNEPVPTVEYDFSKLPPAVQAVRNKLIEAAKSGDVGQLKAIMDANPDHQPPDLGADDTAGKDPVAYLKSISGDPEGREILAIMLDILAAGYVHVDVGTPEEAYVWPYFARYPIDKLTPPQLVEVYRILTASDFDEMKGYGAYMFYRLGITPDGNWAYFQGGD